MVMILETFLVEDWIHHNFNTANADCHSKYSAGFSPKEEGE